VKVIPSDNPLSELITFEHTADLAGKTADYEYEWKYAPPVDGFSATGGRDDESVSGANQWNRHQALYTLGASGVLILSDN